MNFIRSPFVLVFVLALFCVSFFGCASLPQGSSKSLPLKPPDSPGSVTAGWSEERLYDLTCRLGAGPEGKAKEIQGSVWLKIQSKELHGQFNANVIASSDPLHSGDELKLEITHFFGMVLGRIYVHEGHYWISKGSSPLNPSEVKIDPALPNQVWGGIPIAWANSLFLGSFPCPKSSQVGLHRDEANQLRVNVSDKEFGRQQFIFRYQKIEDQGSPWPESLHWERMDDPQAFVDFKFERPDAETRAPLVWEATSTQGSIKVKWKDRQIQAK